MSDTKGWNEHAGTDIGAEEHLASDRMNAYVRNGLAEPERGRAERHLAACDDCLQLFMATVESAGLEAGVRAAAVEPQMVLPDMELLEQRVVAQLLSEEKPDTQAESIQSPQLAVQEKSYRPAAWLQHPVTHYTIAASITLLLLGSGIFSSFSHRLAQMDLNVNVQQPVIVPDEQQTESWSDKMVDQTGFWLDDLKAIRFK